MITWLLPPKTRLWTVANDRPQRERSLCKPLFVQVTCTARRSGFLRYRRSCRLTGRMSDTRRSRPSLPYSAAFLYLMSVHASFFLAPFGILGCIIAQSSAEFNKKFSYFVPKPPRQQDLSYEKKSRGRLFWLRFTPWKVTLFTFDYSWGMISFLLYVPQFLQTLWGTISAPHLLHFTKVGADIFQFALLLSLLPLEDLFLGQIDIRLHLLNLMICASYALS